MTAGIDSMVLSPVSRAFCSGNGGRSAASLTNIASAVFFRGTGS